MSTRCTTPQAPRGRVDEVRDLVGAEGDGQVGAHVRPVEPAGVDVDAGRHVDRDDRHARAARRAPPRPRSRSPGRPPMPTIPSTTTSGARRVGGGDDATAGGAQRGEARRRAPSTTAAPPRPRAAAPGQQRAGVQRVTAVVARPDQQQHPRGRTRRRAGRATADRQPGRGPLHQRALGQPGHQVRLGRPHLLDGVGAAHGPHASDVRRPVCRHAQPKPTASVISAHEPAEQCSTASRHHRVPASMSGPQPASNAGCRRPPAVTRCPGRRSSTSAATVDAAVDRRPQPEDLRRRSVR